MPNMDFESLAKLLGGMGGLDAFQMTGAGGGAGGPRGYLDQIPEILQKYFSPYINAGMGALPTLQSQYGQLVNDPAALMAKWGAGYKESPGFQRKMQYGQTAAQNALAAGGMAGSPLHAETAARAAEDVANEDYNNYLRDVMGLYGLGLQGQQGLYGTGAKAGMGLGQDLASVLGSQAQLSQWQQMMQMMRENAENQQSSNFWGNLFGGIGKGLSFLL